MTKAEVLNREALTKAVSGVSLTNYPAIFEGFLERGIPEDQIMPRENVFTYRAWKALGRQVRRGEHGIKVVTYIETFQNQADPQTGEEKRIPTGRRPWSTTVFHISQTDPVKAS